VEEYVRVVNELQPLIFEEAGLGSSPNLRDEFIFMAGLRKLWHIVDSQYRLLEGALTLTEDQGVSEIAIGGSKYSRRAESYRVIRRLRAETFAKLVELEIFPLVEAESLHSLAFLVSEQTAGSG
jgi:hypothetical protein